MDLHQEDEKVRWKKVWRRVSSSATTLVLVYRPASATRACGVVRRAQPQPRRDAGGAEGRGTKHVVSGSVLRR
ncbi:hypothetical protein E2C01_090386 [Portunus trituberculatus]|uniref:Uncharacterized protein n=1 Tax=Portunus trituberculatus TaxID=210409 RepID=A0A5B7JQ72_PORTR|nr:hypothetical protein [Portunus trituberculatus]